MEWSGQYQDTIWGFRQHAYSDIGIVILGFGLAVMLVSFNVQLRTAQDSDDSPMHRP